MAEFDPSKPHEVLDAGNAASFDPAKPFEEVAEPDKTPKAKTPADKRESFGEGLMDPWHGAAQLLENIVPKRVERTVNEANNWLAEHTGLVGKLPEGGLNEKLRQREAEIAKRRGPDAGFDWDRLAGNILNPANYMGLGVTRATGVFPSIARATAGGAAAGAMQPATKENYAGEKIGQILMGAGTGGALGIVGQAASASVKALGTFLARNDPENIENTAVQAVLRRISQDAKAGGPSAADAIDLVNASKKPITLTDVGGENTTALAGQIARKPGPGRQIASDFLTKRDEASAERISADIAQHLHSGETVQQASEALLQSRSAAARPAYNAAYDLKTVWSPKLETFLSDPVMREGLARGYEIERLVSKAEGRPITASQLGVDLDVDGNIKLLDKPNMRLLDMGKQGLDAMVAAERNELTGRLTARGVALDKFRRAYLGELDALDTKGVYKKARETWAGYSQSLDAIKMGRSVFQGSPEENAAAVAAMSPANREFYRLGVADMLKERLAKAGLSGDEAKQIIRNAWMRDQLKPAFADSKDFNAFVDSITTETKMFGKKYEVLGGSQTAKRASEDVESPGWEKAVETMSHLARGNLFKATKNFYNMWHDLGMKPSSELNEKVAQILFRANLPAEDRVTQKLLGKLGSQLKNPAAGMARGVSAGTQGLAPAAATDVTHEHYPTEQPE